jgi:hypothetical protein
LIDARCLTLHSPTSMNTTPSFCVSFCTIDPNKNNPPFFCHTPHTGLHILELVPWQGHTKTVGTSSLPHSITWKPRI